MGAEAMTEQEFRRAMKERINADTREAIERLGHKQPELAVALSGLWTEFADIKFMLRSLGAQEPV